MKEMLKMKRVLSEILAKHTGRTVEEIEQETERNRYFTSQEAKDYRLVDDVLIKMTDEKKPA
jgi:ATP-dependent Clp protease protease subunit